MPINYDLLDEGDTLTAASLNTRVASLQTGVNDLVKQDLGAQALRSEHLPSLVKKDTMFLYGTTTGMSKICPTPNTTGGAFNNRLGNPVSRNTVHIGPGGAVQGYSIISSRASPGIATPGIFPGVQTDCNISFNPSVNVVSTTTPATGFSDTTYCTGLLVRLNVSILTHTLTQQLPPAFTPDSIVMGIVWEADGALGTYNFLEQSETGTESLVGHSMATYSDLSTSALITSTDTGGASVARISGVIANLEFPGSFTIREWNMSIIPIFGGTL